MTASNTSLELLLTDKYAMNDSKVDYKSTVDDNKKTVATKNRFNQLDDALLINIALYLSFKDMCALSYVNRSFLQTVHFDRTLISYQICHVFPRIILQEKSNYFADILKFMDDAHDNHLVRVPTLDLLGAVAETKMEATSSIMVGKITHQLWDVQNTLDQYRSFCSTFLCAPNGFEDPSKCGCSSACCYGAWCGRTRIDLCCSGFWMLTVAILSCLEPASASHLLYESNLVQSAQASLLRNFISSGLHARNIDKVVDKLSDLKIAKLVTRFGVLANRYAELDTVAIQKPASPKVARRDL